MLWRQPASHTIGGFDDLRFQGLAAAGDRYPESVGIAGPEQVDNVGFALASKHLHLAGFNGQVENLIGQLKQQ